MQKLAHSKCIVGSKSCEGDVKEGKVRLGGREYAVRLLLVRQQKEILGRRRYVRTS